MAATSGRATVLVTLLIGILATACTVTSDPRLHPAPGLQTPTIDDLEQALARWHQVAASVVYRTERQRPGVPSSAHQCLRRYVDDRADIPIGLEKCDPSGIARLVWDPPARWRLEVTEAARTVSATVVDGRSVVCAQLKRGSESCRSSDRLVRAFPFHELVADVRPVLHELDIDPLGPVTVTRRLIGIALADCYERASGGSSAEWCFASDGTLLALELRTEARGPTLLEAERSSSEVRWTSSRS